MIVALCGGVGGSKLVSGLFQSLAPDELTVIVNTADDLTFCGLHVSPDLDTVTYTLAGLAQREFGWGIEGDTFHALGMLEQYGAPVWFRVGDRDLATDIYRTEALRTGCRLTEVAAHIATSLGIKCRILPMTDDPVITRLLVDGEWLPFQEYFVHRGHRDPVTAVRYEGIESSRPSPEVDDALSAAEVVIIVNSNPILSILPIVSIPDVKRRLTDTSAARVAISPIVGAQAVTGPAGELMRLIGCPSSALGVARAYRDLINGIVIDRTDADQRASIEELGLAVLCTDTIMRSEHDRRRLGAETLKFAWSLS